jgi:mannosyltransferase OCH1-like enzyme
MNWHKNDITIHLFAPKDKNKWHPVWKHCYKFWENSNYKVILWDDESIDKLLQEDDNIFFEKINSLDKIFKLDYARYLILEKFGGAYFDMDVEVIIDFLPFLSPKPIYIVEASYQVDEIVQNSIMISLEKTKDSTHFWNHVREHSKYKIINNFESCKNFYSKLPCGTIVRETVGPIMLSNAYSSYHNIYNIQLLSHLHFNRYPHNFKVCIHHQVGTWVKNSNNLT